MNLNQNTCSISGTAFFSKKTPCIVALNFYYFFAFILSLTLSTNYVLFVFFFNYYFHNFKFSFKVTVTLNFLRFIFVFKPLSESVPHRFPSTLHTQKISINIFPLLYRIIWYKINVQKYFCQTIQFNLNG